MNPADDRGAPRPWYREPMLWLVIALPLAVVIAGFATLFIAIDAGGGDPVRQPVQRTAQMQTADLAPEARASQLGLSAELQRSQDTGAVRVRLSDASAAVDVPAADAARLRLTLAHPTRAAADTETWLTRQGGEWLGRLPVRDAPHDWLLSLEPDGAAWRLHGRLRARADKVRLGLGQ